jgi:UDP-N-acetylglucosamine diphosphorylase / glucose-1-phosphate thymidylyltransferase / UDP-N-acetylgalactosamine diphosphorylase / glucosamine-1-phosphate N-acetyltransferase / galactosamine-1-phosphate N-acetyltransferase
VKTILILGGQSRRFWPLGEKPLFPVCGKTLAEHQVDRLKKAGCKDIILVASAENKTMLEELFPKLLVVEQKKGTMGMHHAGLAALPLCKSEPVLIVLGNDFLDPSAYKAVLAEGKKKGVDGAILAQKVEKYFPGGYLTVEKGRITSIIEKPAKGKEPSDLVNIAAHLHGNASVLLDALQKTDMDADDGYERALDSLLKNHHYRAVPHAGTWQAVKYPWHLLQLLPLLLVEIKKPSVHTSASVHKTAVIQGNVVIGKNVRILPHATVLGPCFIGEGTVIGNNAFVRSSSIGAHCVVGYNTEVKGSVLAGPVWMHMAYLGDSVVGRNVSFGGGCMTGNLRLDEGEITSKIGEETVGSGLTKLGAVIGDDCRFGIQVGMNPGVKIGAGSFVSGGLIVSQDIPGGSFVRMKDGKLEVRENKTMAPAMAGRAKYFR